MALVRSEPFALPTAAHPLLAARHPATAAKAEETPSDCAARAYFEASSNASPSARDYLAATLTGLPLPGVAVAWVPEHRLALYLVDADEPPVLANVPAGAGPHANAMSFALVGTSLAGDHNSQVPPPSWRLAWVPLRELLRGHRPALLPKRLGHPDNVLQHLAASTALHQWAAAVPQAPPAPAPQRVRKLVAQTLFERRAALFARLGEECTAARLYDGRLPAILDGLRVTIARPPDDASDEHVFEMVTPTDPEYQRIVDMVTDPKVGHKVPLLIKRVRVKARWEAYEACLARIAAECGLDVVRDRAAIERPWHVWRAGTMHGTGSTDAAHAIARYGFDLQRCRNNGYGKGFYLSDSMFTARDYSKVSINANPGSILLCDIVQGKILNQGCSGDIPAPYHSVQILYPHSPGNYLADTTTAFVVATPDQMRVRYIVDFNKDDTARAAEEKLLPQLKRSERHLQRLEALQTFMLAREMQGKRAREFYTERLEAIQSDLAVQGDNWVGRAEALHAREKEHFTDPGLRVLYSHKRPILEHLRARTNAVVVLQGGTGIGKTVCTPQWMLDDVLAHEGRPMARVAVLVPRIKIAEEQAAYLASKRGTALGTEVGFATGRAVNYHPTQSRIVFFTPGFFRAAECRAEQPLQPILCRKWAAVIVDEVHELTGDMQQVAALVVQAAAARGTGSNGLRLVLMSATIDPEKLQSTLAELGAPTPIATVSVPGANYPVERYFLATLEPLSVGQRVRASANAPANLCLGSFGSRNNGTVEAAYNDGRFEVRLSPASGKGNAGAAPSDTYRRQHLEVVEEAAEGGAQTASALSARRDLSLTQELSLEPGALTWDPDGDDSLEVLVEHVLRILHYEEAEFKGDRAALPSSLAGGSGSCKAHGGILVFVPSIGCVMEGVRLLQSKLGTSASSVEVLPLHGRLTPAQQQHVSTFCDSSSGSGKRLVCFATNIAEAGVTIRGLSAVIDSGRELCVYWDPVLRAQVKREAWISKAQHEQRRGRVGRTGPGRCYCLFDEATYLEHFPAYPSTGVEREDLRAYALQLLAAGYNPQTLPLLTPGEEGVMPGDDRMEAALQELLALGAVTGAGGGAAPVPFSITARGRLMAQLPLHPDLCGMLLEALPQTPSAAPVPAFDALLRIVSAVQASLELYFFIPRDVASQVGSGAVAARKWEAWLEKEDARQGDFQALFIAVNRWMQARGHCTMRTFCQQYDLDPRALRSAVLLESKLRGRLEAALPAGLPPRAWAAFPREGGLNSLEREAWDAVKPLIFTALHRNFAVNASAHDITSGLALCASAGAVQQTVRVDFASVVSRVRAGEGQSLLACVFLQRRTAGKGTKGTEVASVVCTVDDIADFMDTVAEGVREYRRVPAKLSRFRSQVAAVTSRRHSYVPATFFQNDRLPDFHKASLLSASVAALVRSYPSATIRFMPSNGSLYLSAPSELFARVQEDVKEAVEYAGKGSECEKVVVDHLDPAKLAELLPPTNALAPLALATQAQQARGTDAQLKITAVGPDSLTLLTWPGAAEGFRVYFRGLAGAAGYEGLAAPPTFGERDGLSLSLENVLGLNLFKAGGVLPVRYPVEACSGTAAQRLRAVMDPSLAGEEALRSLGLGKLGSMLAVARHVVLDMPEGGIFTPFFFTNALPFLHYFAGPAFWTLSFYFSFPNPPPLFPFFSPLILSGCAVYGGFIRDVILRGDLHAEADLDIAIPHDARVAYTYYEKLMNWGVHEKPEPRFELKSLGAEEFKHLGRRTFQEGSFTLSLHNPGISTFFFHTLEHSSQAKSNPDGAKSLDKFEVQVVNTQAEFFKKQGPPVDFTCSNLQIMRAKPGQEPRLEVKHRETPVGLSVGFLINDCAQHIARELQVNGPDKRYRRMFSKRHWQMRAYGDWMSQGSQQ